MKLHVVFGTGEHFNAVADSESMNYALARINRIKGTHQELQVNVSNYGVILAFCVLVKEGVISPNDIQFYEAKHPVYSNVTIDKSTFDNPIKVDRNGTLSEYPKCFDTHTAFYMRLMDTATV